MEKTIHTLWLQGEDQAPELVRLCFSRWRHLNPDWCLRVHTDQSEQLKALRNRLPISGISVQAQSDILRSYLVHTHGGFWVDATLFPCKPISKWENFDLNRFFAFSGFPRADIISASTWCFYAPQKNKLAAAWWKTVCEYWKTPRSPFELLGNPGEKFKENYKLDPEDFVGIKSSNNSTVFPYFWFVYLFHNLIKTSETACAEWKDAPTLPAKDAHHLQRYIRTNKGISEAMLNSCITTPVQKLNWRDKQSVDAARMLSKFLEEY